MYCSKEIIPLGTRVRIKTKHLSSYVLPFGITSDMRAFEGSRATIVDTWGYRRLKEYDNRHEGFIAYKLNTDKGIFMWGHFMLEIIDETISIYDKVK